jgi:aminoglycoside phosphotransferase family enzyme/predicted kinase
VNESVDDRGIDDLARSLAKQESWPCGAAKAEWIQTHISHVFLTKDRVYKLRKSVRLPFLDFSSRALRNEDCLREVVLNRRLAPEVYLGVAPILSNDASVQVGRTGETPDDASLEYVVVMRRLPSGHDALSMLDEARLELRHLEAVADRLQTFHASHGLGVPAPWSAEAWFDRIEAPVLACLESLAESKGLPTRRLESLRSKTVERLEALKPRFEDRRRHGRAIDAHGDLHLDHIWFDEGSDAPLIIDCIEFSDDLRRIDSASEVAFLAMDLRYRGHRDLAEAFLHAYASRVDDYDLFSTVDFFSAYRALVRAKVAALAAVQESIATSQREKARASVERHVALAEALFETPKPTGLILLCGTVGSGKSTVARDLTASGHGIPIASDRVRKALAGIPATAHSTEGTDEGIYRPDRTENVYAALFERALPVLEGGRTAILDASFATRAHRDVAREWAAERGLPIRLIEIRCDPKVALSRLRERKRVGADPSDAGPDFLPISQARFEAPDEWPAEDHEVVWSDAGSNRERP